MTTARALMRFALAGLFVNFVAVACVVSDGDDDDDTTSCDPGAFKDCTCADGSEGTKKCNASGSGYGSCVDCAGSNVGGEGGGGSPTAGTAGTAGTNGGETSSQGGAGAGGEANGGAGEAGAGGAATDPNALCLQAAPDACYECAQLDCCDAWKACVNETEGDCEQQFFNIMECARINQSTADVTTADLESCAEVEVAGGSAWSDGLLPSTKPLIDCVAGPGWAAAGEFPEDSCESLCFLKP